MPAYLECLVRRTLPILSNNIGIPPLRKPRTLLVTLLTALLQTFQPRRPRFALVRRGDREEGWGESLGAKIGLTAGEDAFEGGMDVRVGVRFGVFGLGMVVNSGGEEGWEGGAFGVGLGELFGEENDLIVRNVGRYVSVI